MTTFQLEENSLEALNAIDLMAFDGGKGWQSWVEIGLGVAAVGLAIAAEIGTAGLATVPATSVASAGVGAILHGAHTL